MKKLTSILALTMLLTVFTGSQAFAAAGASGEEQENITLTDQQKQELSSLYKEEFATKKKIVEKYVEYGVLSEEKGKEFISRMDEHFKMIEENGFQLPKPHHHRPEHR